MTLIRIIMREKTMQGETTTKTKAKRTPSVIQKDGESVIVGILSKEKVNETWKQKEVMQPTRN
eukprot:UN00259